MVCNLLPCCVDRVAGGEPKSEIRTGVKTMALDVNGYNDTFKTFVDFAKIRKGMGEKRRLPASPTA